MTAIVRIFAHSGLITAPVAPGSGRFSTDSVGLLKQPPLGRERFEVAAVALNSSASVSESRHTALLLVQVQPGKVVHYECTPQSFELAEASTTSPTISGEVVIQFGQGWTISFLENTDV